MVKMKRLPKVLNVIDDITRKNKIHISYNDTEKILGIFAWIDLVSTQVDSSRKRMVSVKLILRQLFRALGIEYKFIPFSKSKKTLNSYDQWWIEVYGLIKNDIA